MNFWDVLTLLAGLSFFLFGMSTMSNGLEKAAGSKLEVILKKMTSNLIVSVFVGAAITAVIQSSSATTVMLVGLVNSGLMAFENSIGVIFGANIGTTITAWFLSLVGVQSDSFVMQMVKPQNFSPILAIIGVIMIMSAKDNTKKNDIGMILIGFAVLMFGMEAMSDAMSGLKENEQFHQILIMFENPVFGILAGTLLTAIIQSSSASIGILQALSLSGIIPMSTALPIILGQNIGTTITPILSSISGNTESKRVAISCVYIKVIGVVVICAAFYILHGIVGFDFMNENATVFSIAITHTLFNVFSTVILIPFCNLIEKLAVWTFKSKKVEEDDRFRVLDDRFLSVPG
ncbi:MAG: Na/Pi cotransporter family protein, partial [Clostridia bacterium]|nr:Na/Pi cotransporter family protein [Clostridia bacterium]